jgi:hypothetical protein
MRFLRTIDRLSFSTILLFLVLSGCLDVAPDSEIVNLYKSPKYDRYVVHSVALLPMAQDDTTDSGTLYATNHFLNSLKENYPEMKFVIPAFEERDDYDSLIVNTIESIEEVKRLNTKNFFNSYLGAAIDEENPDAVIIGKIDRTIPKSGFIRRYYAKVVSCEFRYYLISMVDGRVLWKADVLGEEGYYVSQILDLYPPLDLALSNGIDKIISELPFTKITKPVEPQEK